MEKEVQKQHISLSSFTKSKEINRGSHQCKAKGQQCVCHFLFSLFPFSDFIIIIWNLTNSLHLQQVFLMEWVGKEKNYFSLIHMEMHHFHKDLFSFGPPLSSLFSSHFISIFTSNSINLVIIVYQLKLLWELPNNMTFIIIPIRI